MKATIWGCRGSLATPGPGTARYGGNTSCVEIRAAGGAVIVLDAGTGIRPLGIKLRREQISEVHLLLTHMHLDHVEGLGFFLPLFDPACEVYVWGPRPTERSLEEHIAGYVSPPLFPVPFYDIPGHATFVEIWDEPFEVGGVSVTPRPVQHPGRTVGYRLEEDGRSFAFIPDNEPALDQDSGVEIATGVDLLFHDAQFTADEYATRVGWGHSAIPDFAEFIRRTDPKRALMFHHDPSHTDDDLETMLPLARELTGRDDIQIAAEGMTIDLSANG